MFSGSVGKNNDFIVAEYHNLIAVYSNLAGNSNLKELIKHFHDNNMDVRIIFEMENDWRNCLLLNQRNLNNQTEIDKCLHMLSMDESILQRHLKSTLEIHKYASRSIINLQKWNVLDERKEGNGLLQSVSQLLHDSLSLDSLFVPENFDQALLNASIFHELNSYSHVLAQKLLGILHFDHYDKLFGFHLLIEKLDSSNLWLGWAKFCRENRLFDLSYASLLKINNLASCEVVME